MLIEPIVATFDSFRDGLEDPEVSIIYTARCYVVDHLIGIQIEAL